MRASILAVGTFLVLTWCAIGDDDEGYIALYTGIGTTQRVLIHGRALEEAPPAQPAKKGSVPGNIVRTLRMLSTDELEQKSVTVHCAGRTAEGKTDAEGNFRVIVESGDEPFPTGEVLVQVELDVSKRRSVTADGSALIYRTPVARIIVCDVDDTLVDTRIDKPVKAGWKTLTGDSARMKPIPGMCEFLRVLAAPEWEDDLPGPVAYVSGGAVNIQPRLSGFLERNGFPRGALFLRNLGFGEGNDSWSVQKYKLKQIESVLEVFPDGELVLIGDSGETDPETYAVVRDRYPDEVLAIFIRLVGDSGRRPESKRFGRMRTFRTGEEAWKAAEEEGLVPARTAADTLTPVPSEGGDE